MQQGPLYYHSRKGNFTFADMVEALRANPAIILSRLTPELVDLWHAASGVAGEGGEFLDEVKKIVAYGKPIDRNKLLKEMGDLEFYLEWVRQILKVDRQEVLDLNVDKLVLSPDARYANLGYSDAEAIQRTDVQQTLPLTVKGE